MIQCPHCNKAISLALFTAHLGSLSKGKTSERKKKASRENGQKGGRPKQKGKG
jgi:hypothetical protein